METAVKETVKQSLDDILLDISWAKIAQRYFDKSSSWLYHKLNGIDGNGKQQDFTQEEKELLRDSLYDLAERLRMAADKIK